MGRGIFNKMAISLIPRAQTTMTGDTGARALSVQASPEAFTSQINAMSEGLGVVQQHSLAVSDHFLNIKRLQEGAAAKAHITLRAEQVAIEAEEFIRANNMNHETGLPHYTAEQVDFEFQQRMALEIAELQNGGVAGITLSDNHTRRTFSADAAGVISTRALKLRTDARATQASSYIVGTETAIQESVKAAGAHTYNSVDRNNHLETIRKNANELVALGHWTPEQAEDAVLEAYEDVREGDINGMFIAASRFKDDDQIADPQEAQALYESLTDPNSDEWGDVDQATLQTYIKKASDLWTNMTRQRASDIRKFEAAEIRERAERHRTREAGFLARIIIDSMDKKEVIERIITDRDFAIEILNIDTSDFDGISAALELADDGTGAAEQYLLENYPMLFEPVNALELTAALSSDSISKNGLNSLVQKLNVVEFVTDHELFKNVLEELRKAKSADEIDAILTERVYANWGSGFTHEDVGQLVNRASTLKDDTEEAKNERLFSGLLDDLIKTQGYLDSLIKGDTTRSAAYMGNFNSLIRDGMPSKVAFQTVMSEFARANASIFVPENIALPILPENTAIVDDDGNRKNLQDWTLADVDTAKIEVRAMHHGKISSLVLAETRLEIVEQYLIQALKLKRVYQETTGEDLDESIKEQWEKYLRNNREWAEKNGYVVPD